MFYLVLALGLFFLSVALHVLFCRFSSRRGLQVKAYVVIVLLCFSIYAILALLFWDRGILDPLSVWGASFQMSAGIVFILFIPVYLSFYVLTELMSPSKRILLAIASQGELTYEELLQYIRKERFIETRLNDLCASGCVIDLHGRYSLSPSGEKLARFLDFMQALLGRETGG